MEEVNSGRLAVSHAHKVILLAFYEMARFLSKEKWQAQ